MVGLIFAVLFFIILGLWWPLLVAVETIFFLSFFYRRSRLWSDDAVDDISTSGPMVSIVVPAKNEESDILDCLISLANLEYEHIEIIVVDDMSTDQTSAVVKGWLNTYSGPKKFRLVISPAEPPSGWVGKTFAADYGITQSSGSIILITDVDVVHNPKSLSTSISYLLDKKADMLVRIPYIELGSFGEWPILFFIFILKFGSWFGLSFLGKKETFSLGTYTLFTRAFYDESGGWKEHRSFPETLPLARYALRSGKKFVVLDDDRKEITARMYTGFLQMTHGIIRNTNYKFIETYPFFAVCFVSSLAFDGIIKLFSYGSLYQGVFETLLFSLLFGTYLRISRYPLSVAVTGGLLSPLFVLYFMFVSILSGIRTLFDIPMQWRGRPIHAQ